MTDHDELTRLNDAFIAAVQASDTAYFERTLSPDFLNSNPDGSLKDRAGYIAQIAKPAGITGLQAHDVLIRVFGEFAIIHGRTAYAKADGGAGAGRYTDIWHKREGRWLCIAAHVTRG